MWNAAIVPRWHDRRQDSALCQMKETRLMAGLLFLSCQGVEAGAAPLAATAGLVESAEEVLAGVAPLAAFAAMHPGIQLELDLSNAAGGKVQVSLLSPADFGRERIVELAGDCIDELDIEVDNYAPCPEALRADAANIVGPLINGKQLDSVLTKIEQAKKDGATLLVGGAPQGNVLPPHLFVDVDPSWSIAVDETFGPVLPVIKARDEAHALELANASEYGLSAAVFTRDYARGLHFARGIRSGMCHINDITVDDQTNAPFGGEKNSGLGRFNGEWAIEEFTRAQWVTLQFQPRPYPF